MFRTLKDPNDPNSVVYEYYDKDSARDRYGFVTPEAVRSIIRSFYKLRGYY